MNEEIPYNPPGMDEYIREGARQNSALLRRMEGQSTPSETVGAKAVALQGVCSAAWLERVKALDAEYSRLQKLIDESFASEQQHNENAGERIPLVVKQFEVKRHADDIEALLDGKMPPAYEKKIHHYAEKRQNDGAKTRPQPITDNPNR